jgi:cob(I)alamin adenosyltransferase
MIFLTRAIHIFVAANILKKNNNEQMFIIFVVILSGSIVDMKGFIQLYTGNGKGKTTAALEIVITGRYAPPELLELADLVTEMKEVKHYYNQGVQAREGIEY